MTIKKIIKSFLCLLVVVIFISGQVNTLYEMPNSEMVGQENEATRGSNRTWYVRPKDGGIYGLGNGTTYDNAWSGLSNIVWGGRGVKAGDTLYICGTHYENMEVKGTGNRRFPITIRGDYDDDPGIFDGSMDIKTGKAEAWKEIADAPGRWEYRISYSNYVLINDKFCKWADSLDELDQEGKWHFK